MHQSSCLAIACTIHAEILVLSFIRFQAGIDDRAREAINRIDELIQLLLSIIMAHVT